MAPVNNLTAQNSREVVRASDACRWPRNSGPKADGLKNSEGDTYGLEESLEQTMNKDQPYSVDLSGIEPERRGEVRRRLNALAEYELSPGRENAERLAATLGLGAAQFYNLARAWRTLRDPAAIAGGSRPRNRQVQIEAIQAKLLDDAMSSLPDGMPEQLIHKAEQQARTGGITMPSSDKMKRYIHANRIRKLPTQLAKLGDWIVDHTVVEIPVVNRETAPQRPLATAVIDSRLNSIIAVDLSLGLPSVPKIAAVLIRAIGLHSDENVGFPKIAVGLPFLNDQRWAELVTSVAAAGSSVVEYTPGAYEHGRCVEALLGLRHEGIRLRPRLVLAPPTRRVSPANGMFNPVSLVEAERLLRKRFGISDKPGSKLSEQSDGVLHALLANLREIAKH